jgi:CRP/FNR family transcriptional regulator, cyclic AMP receptor protein
MSIPTRQTRQTIAVLEADPDLATAVHEPELDAAQREAVAVVMKLEVPRWDPSRIRIDTTEGWLGLLFIDGLVMRRVTVGKRHACELLGPGDLIRPWDADREYDPLPIAVDWQVLSSTRLAVLDRSFALRVSRWPGITSRLVARVATRARHLALMQAVTHLPRANDRLLLLFWLLAERWGKVGRDGVHVQLPLTHEILAMLVGAQRPTVTIALHGLAEANLLSRESRDRWLLTNLAIEQFADPGSGRMSAA